MDCLQSDNSKKQAFKIIYLLIRKCLLMVINLCLTKATNYFTTFKNFAHFTAATLSSPTSKMHFLSEAKRKIVPRANQSFWSQS